MKIRGKIILSTTLRCLMHENRIALEAQRGNPTQGKCVDCKRDVPAHEFAVKCNKCDDSFVCVWCVDKHDHLHAALGAMGLIQFPN